MWTFAILIPAFPFWALLSKMEKLLAKSVNSITEELRELEYIGKYAPEYNSDIQVYNDNLLGFKRLYCDAYRFLKRYIVLGKLDYILMLYPRHIYWNITPKVLNHILCLISQGSEMDLVNYFIGCNLAKSDVLYSKYINLLGEAKMDFIKMKNDKCGGGE